MAITINGTGSITGLTAGGLPDGIITAADLANDAVTAEKLATTLDLTGKTVTMPSGIGGKILQITQGTQSTQMSTTSQTYQDTNLSASITPSANDSKILVLISAPTAVSRSTNAAQFSVRLVRNSTPIWEPTQTSTFGVYAQGATVTALRWVFSLMHLDSPGTTSSTTYKTQLVTYNSSTTAYSQYSNSPSYMYLVEVAA